MYGVLGRIPEEGAVADLDGFRFVAERVRGRRIISVLVTTPPPQQQQA
jgi:CBS domain containing-hemolysin-like protein